MLLSWGKPKIYVKDLDTTSAKFRLLADSVEDSTNLETIDGDKMEAKVEGGGVEDVNYKGDNYTLNTEIRIMKGRKKPFNDVDGKVQHNYEVYLQPEDPTAIGIHIPKAHVDITTSYTAAEGIKQAIKFDALENDTTTRIELGTVSVSGGNPSIVKLDAESETSE